MPRRSGATDGLTKTISRFDSASARLDKLEQPDGNQLGQALAKVNALISSLPSLITAALTAGFHMTGRMTADGGITSIDVRGRTVLLSYASVYADVNGVFGAITSSRRGKQDIVERATEAEPLMALVEYDFRRKDAVKKYGDLAPVEHGLMAEDVAEVAPWAVFFDEEGNPEGIRYEMLSVALLGVVKSLDARLKALGG
ncbi:MAG TPA: hypothetical protein VGM94_06665 [Galbitalea sp.]|jgi:hypothetical protein